MAGDAADDFYDAVTSEAVLDFAAECIGCRKCGKRYHPEHGDCPRCGEPVPENPYAASIGEKK